MPESAEQPVVLDVPATDPPAETAPAGQIDHPDVPTPADAIDQDPPEDIPAVARHAAVEDVTPGSTATILPPGAYFEFE
jgi:hypothetical protein